MVSRARPWAYAACVWAVLFAALSFYWAAGGDVGIETIGPALVAEARSDPLFVVLGLWGAGVAKLLGGVAALGLVAQWGRRLGRFRRLLRWTLLVGGGLVILYGVASGVQHALMLAGVVPVPVGLGRVAAIWHLVFWDPWWLVGGVLFALAAWRSPSA